MKIGFISVQYSSSNNFYIKIGQQLRREHGIECIYISNSMKAKIDGGKVGADVLCFPEVIREIEEMPKDEYEAMKKEVESRTDAFLIRSLYLTDPGLRKESESRLYEKTIRHFMAWKVLFGRYNFDCLITGNGGELIRQVAYWQSRSEGRPMLFLEHLPFPSLSDSNNSLKSLCISSDNRYFKVKSTGVKAVPKEAKERIDKFIKEFKARRKPHVYFPPPLLNITRIKKFFKELYTDFVIERRRNEYFLIPELALKALKNIINMRLVKFLSRQPSAGSKYIYFPLHVEGDFQLTNIAPHCKYQDYLINLIADALPYGYELYIKEHPARIGNIGFKRLRRILRTERVILISPFVNSHELIENSAAVISVNSTTGFEALLYSKPVITLGECFYRNHGLTIDVEGFNQIPEALRTALSSDYKVDLDKLYRFLYEAMNSAYEGTCVEWDTGSDEPAQKVAASIWQRLESEKAIR
jgi:hypothetical protein